MMNDCSMNSRNDLPLFFSIDVTKTFLEFLCYMIYTFSVKDGVSFSTFRSEVKLCFNTCCVTFTIFLISVPQSLQDHPPIYVDSPLPTWTYLVLPTLFL